MKLKPIKYKYSILIILIFLVLSCKRESKTLTENPIWEQFKTGIENRDLTYLLNNSLDSINCVDCILEKANKLQLSQFIFENHLEKLYNPELLKGKKYSIYDTDSIIRISYNFEKLFSNESSSIIYMFDKTEKKYLFTGMITIP